jgi:hypothetical protein
MFNLSNNQILSAQLHKTCVAIFVAVRLKQTLDKKVNCKTKEIYSLNLPHKLKVRDNIRAVFE